MNELKSVNFGLNKFCAPSVMSALTGRSTDECAAVITSINGRKEIKAVNIPDIIKAFEKLRFIVKEQTIYSRTLFGVLNKLASNDGIYLVTVPHHIIAIQVENGQVQLVDNASREPLDAGASARLTQRVERVFEVTPKPQPVFVLSEITIDKDKYLDVLNIYRISRYANPEDDVKVSLGYIRYNGGAELTEIVSALSDLVLLEITK